MGLPSLVPPYGYYDYCYYYDYDAESRPLMPDIHHLRNIGVIAHIDAGKTTITERMLFYSGFSHRVGEVDKGTTVTDFDPEEQERGITINAAAVTFPWKDVEINLIDTPGHVDFTAEVERSLRVLDGGVVVFSAREGVEAQSETVWRQADKYHVPRIAFINKMDREGADFFRTLDEIRQRLNCQPIPLNLPVGAGPPHIAGGFSAVYDLIAMQKLSFTGEGEVVPGGEVSDSVREDAELWHHQMLDQLSAYSDEMTERILADEPVPAELVRRVLREGTIDNRVVPVFCGSALDGIGVQPVLDAVAAYLPSPADVPPVEGVDPKKHDKKLIRKPDVDEPFCGLVFKIQADRHGDLHYLRIYSGTLKANSRVYNPGKDKKENVPQLWRDAGRSPQPGRFGLGRRHRRHRRAAPLGHRRHARQHPGTDPAGVDHLPRDGHLHGHRAGDFHRAEKTGRRARHDEAAGPHLPRRENEETGQTLISGMGELHLEVIKHRLLRDFRLNVRVHKPRVSYRETIERAVEVTGECHRNVGGQMLSAKVRIRMEPSSRGGKPGTGSEPHAAGTAKSASSEAPVPIFSPQARNRSRSWRRRASRCRKSSSPPWSRCLPSRAKGAARWASR